ncbi:AAA family ATPase [Variovorax flavidus]|uniref:AAA family ATPase n=1 Tax=Variovorax flavidus TaxID=3053501 RepID=UPI00336556F6
MGIAHAQNKLHQLVRPLAADYEYIVIDCPPAVDAPVTQSALLASDVCLIPLQPTPSDLWATQGITELINRARLVNNDLRAFVVANRVSHTRLCHDALDVMREDSDVPVLDATLGSRMSFQQAALEGSVPARMGSAHKVAAAESQAVAREMYERMGWL